MFTTFVTKINLMARDKSLRKRILFTLAALALFRLLATIPIPGVDAARLQQFLSNNQFFGLFNVFSGGGLSRLSIMMLGVGPFITAAIIMQLMTLMSKRIKEMYQEEGEAGRLKFAQYSRLLTVPLAVVKGFGFLTLLARQGILGSITSVDMVVNVVLITAGSILLMWIGELINEFGVGNGVSVIIFAGIVARLPGTVSQLIATYDPSQIPLYVAFLVIAIVVTLGVVIITEAERPIPITYSKQVRGNKIQGGSSTYLPLRLNQAGVIPIIFALSILLFPQMIVNFTQSIQNPIIQVVSNVLTAFLNNYWLYALVYFLLVFAFTYFYTAVTFDPEQIYDNLQKSGALFRVCVQEIPLKHIFQIS